MPRASEPLYLALDQGGHSSRALVFSATGDLIASARRTVETHYPHPGWAEQDAGTLVESLRAASAEVRRSLGRDAVRIRAAGLATQRSNCVCWNRRTGLPLSPAISWQDRRAQDWLARLELSGEEIRARTGLYRSPHYGAAKLRWCLDHLADVRAAAATDELACGPLATFLITRLLEERPLLVDPANAARTLLWNLGTREWDADLLHAFGIARPLLPHCVGTRHDYGTLGVGELSVPLAALSGDQSAALFAEGRPRTDTVYVNIGTGAFLQRPVTGPPSPRDGLLAGIVYADALRADYVLEATVNGAGAALDWARDWLGIRDIESNLEIWLRQEGDIPLFLNGIAGLGSPWWNAQFASRFVGGGEPWAQAVAVAESIVFLIADNLRLLQDGGTAPRVRVSGGLAQIRGLCQRLADVSGLPVTRSPQLEATARGIAWLLADADGLGWASEDGDVIVPQAHPACQARHRQWQDAMRQALMAP
jgi:glycerol kinase